MWWVSRTQPATPATAIATTQQHLIMRGCVASQRRRLKHGRPTRRANHGSTIRATSRRRRHPFWRMPNPSIYVLPPPPAAYASARRAPIAVLTSLLLWLWGGLAGCAVTDEPAAPAPSATAARPA